MPTSRNFFFAPGQLSQKSYSDLLTGSWIQVSRFAPTPLRTVPQKVRGLRATVISPFPYVLFAEIPCPEIVKQRFIYTLSDLLQYTGKMFARPCPFTPRHGFVDSVTVETTEEAQSLFSKARDIDPKSWLVLSRYICASSSMVITPSSAAIGPNNDGATSGKNSFSVPLRDLSLKGINLKLAGIRSGSPYFEFVQSPYYEIFCTQIRSGPSAPAFPDYIPHTTTVKKILPATGDLVAWESLMKQHKNEKGLVVYHPGGSLVSHYAAHAIINRIPVLISAPPEIGQTFQSQEDSPSLDPDAVKEGIVKGLCIGLYDDEANYDDLFNIQASLLAAHHGSAWGGHDQSFVIGCCMGKLLRYAIAACLGENRHRDEVTGEQPKAYLCREQVYRKSFSDLSAALDKLPNVSKRFAMLKWDYSVGGPSWHRCLNATLILDRRLRAFCNSPSIALANDAFSAFINVISQAHNCGPFLNKFTGDSDVFAAAATAKPTSICRGLSGYKKQLSQPSLPINHKPYDDWLEHSDSYSYLPPLRAYMTPRRNGRRELMMGSPIINKFVDICDESIVPPHLFNPFGTAANTSFMDDYGIIKLWSKFAREASGHNSARLNLRNLNPKLLSIIKEGFREVKRANVCYREGR